MRHPCFNIFPNVDIYMFDVTKDFFTQRNCKYVNQNIHIYAVICLKQEGNRSSPYFFSVAPQTFEVREISTF